MTSDRDTLREAVARIVDPSEWANHNPNPMRRLSLIKADAILALIPLSEVQEVLGDMADARCSPLIIACQARCGDLLSKLKAIRGEVSDA